MQKDSVADIELNLKKKARRRLVGAIALVLLMIILLPILLKDRAPVTSQDKVKITLNSDAEKAVDANSLSQAKTTDFDSKVVPDEASSASQEITLPKQASTAAESPDVTEQTAAKQAPTEKMPEHLEHSKSEAIKAESANGVFFVQIGAFTDINKVKELQAKLSELGYKSKTEKVKTPKGDLIRLKSQVFSSRNEAAIALQNIKDAG
ncbi:MAG TPA: SPOR domain-containing protein, partial [Methylophilaceae bacterium]|nr:SPOR domain-containing protein [Methylophilaceae bacterium]